MRFSLEKVGKPKQKTANPLSESAASISETMIGESLETAQVKPSRIYNRNVSTKTHKHKQYKSGDRSQIMITPLCHALRNGIYGFADLSKQHQSKLGYLIWLYGGFSAQHERIGWHDYMPIPYQTLKAYFGKNGFNRINAKLKLFDVTPNWHYKSNQTKGYKPTPKVLAIKSQCMSDCAKQGNVDLTDSNGRKLERLFSEFVSKNTKGRKSKAWSGVKIPNSIQINRQSLSMYQAQLDLILSESTSPEMAIKCEREIYANRHLDLLAQTVINNGAIMQHYQESESGRLYASGINLQNASKLARRAALAGSYSYDIKNCHFAILNQQANRHNLSLPAIDHYLANKKGVRKQIAIDTGLSINQIKTCLIAVMYGATLTTYQDCAIPKTVGVQKAKELIQHPLFNGVYQDVKKARKVILDNSPIVRGRLINAVGNRIVVKEATKAQQLAHLLQGVEALALITVVPEIVDDGLLLHDGFVTNKKLDPRVIEKAIKSATGYDLSLDSSVITSPTKEEVLAKLA